MEMRFDENYPISPPVCTFVPPLLHVNLTRDGTVCSPLLTEGKKWNHETKLKDILVHIQNLLAEPNCTDGICLEPYMLYCMDRLNYNKKVRQSMQI